MKLKIFLILILFSLSFNTYSQKKSKNKTSNSSYNIKIQVTGVKDTVVYLGNYFGDKKYSIDTAEVNSKGEAIFKGDEKLDGGMYLVLFPSRGMSYFEFLVGDDQNFEISTDTTDFYQKNLKVKGSVDNEEFYAFQKQLNDIGKQLHEIQKSMQEKKDDKDFIEAEKAKIKPLSEKREALIESTVKNSKSKTLVTIVNLMREPKIPDFEIDESIVNKDSVERIKKYYYYKDHFFDYIDLTDSVILRTPMFAPKFKQYISQVIIQIPDSVSKAGIDLIEKAKSSPQVFRYLIVYMLDYNNSSKLMGMDRVFVDIAKKYYLTGQATWAVEDSSLMAKIQERVEKLEPNLVGNQAPDLQRLETIDKKPISLYNIDAKYTVIIFWEPNCGHCKKTVPKLYSEYLDMIKKGVDIEVLAIHTQLKREEWEEFVKEKDVTQWINAYDRYMFSNFRNLYDIYSTPVIYLLDKDKKIIAKRLGPEQVQKMVLQLEGIKDTSNNPK